MLEHILYHFFEEINNFYRIRLHIINDYSISAL